MDCIFCKIVSGELPSSKAYEDDEILGFYDISPLAPVHILIISKKHIPSLDEITPEDDMLTAKMLRVITQIAKENGLSEDGYRVISNVGKHGAQSVRHLHFHLLGGRQLEAELG